MQYLPICLQLQGAPVIVIGGGAVATRKARLLLRAGAQLTIVAPAITDALEQLVTEHGGVWRQAQYSASDLDDMVIGIAATDDARINQRIHSDAVARNLPINVVDSPAHCTFIIPSIIDRDPLLIAISSSGTSPVLTRLLKNKIEALVPPRYAKLAQFAGRFREQVKALIPLDMNRRRFWEQVMNGPIAQQLLGGSEKHAEELFAEQLYNINAPQIGEVYLIGAGPGDPDLMTFKAARLLQAAEVVLYDRLVSAPILEMARGDAERIYVGKRRADHAVPQREINQLLVELAKQGKRVARLKGGDPFVFGRGGEEIELLAEHQVPFQVVPGVTAGNGAACYAGIPLTHRDYAQSVRFVTGHLQDGSIDLNWPQFQTTTETLVFYMGLMGLPVICEKLIAHGRKKETPVALIERGTLPQQRVLVGTLATINSIVASERPKAPTLIIVGDVVKLHSKLAWFS